MLTTPETILFIVAIVQTLAGLCVIEKLEARIAQLRHELSELKNQVAYDGF